MKMSTKIIDLRGSKVRPIHRDSVLLPKQEDLCSTSYESLLSMREDLCSTSYSPLIGIAPQAWKSLLHEDYCSTSHYSSSRKIAALRVTVTLRLITLRAVPGDKQ